ncbi:hypothetical protein C4K39_1617 [Pseudomonas sessilinigenes]|nr:hypothetical protein C4K39_1617 [Pseudomonas sessilinigenes]
MPGQMTAVMPVLSIVTGLGSLINEFIDWL